MDKVPSIVTEIGRRHEFVLLFDVRNGNPNGDPDNDNLPRIDPQTGHGIVTDVAIKRKVRDFLSLTRNMPIFIQSETALNRLKEQAEEGLDPRVSKQERASKKPIPRLQQRLCELYYDIRVFGAVLTTGQGDDRLNAGQVRGPVQITFARSIDPIPGREVPISRKARTTEERMETGTTELGRKAIVDYALYRAHGFFNPYLAEHPKTGVTSADLEAFWSAMIDLFTFDRSASRGDMAVRALSVFTHKTKLGEAPAHKLFELIPKPVAKTEYPREYTDYEVVIPDAGDLAGYDYPGVIHTKLV